MRSGASIFSKPPERGFKEWSLVCEALGNGRQSVILRKGGIHEGRGGFDFSQREFALFPTRFHDQLASLKGDEVGSGVVGEPYAIGDEVRIELIARLEASWTVTDWEVIAALKGFHIWSEATVRQRYEWSLEKGNRLSLQVALVRVYRLAEPWVFPYERGHVGCRSWVELEPGAVDCEAVLGEDEAEVRAAEIRGVLG
jgi:hypothetical protein